ncbi:EscU/YscU/HrcU family type III secretion system export apparatus switch protein [Pectinatus frisingensis]|jgi:flagellar biosynthesis protein|uniref:EscU/YscU/HrcU family type III secretion system export apparatus switch protein n=1 Tax=Pectinatus frisingensis TaxID=865 RepID=UPI0015F69822|nr:EscU/YscU/HrcU family type III secretion system export apparatus switch protein [Pectinatus frisingensis]
MDDQEKEPTVPDRQAVALRYREKEGKAPRVIAKGRGYTAESILQTAQRNAVPIYQDKTLLSMLMALELDREIPPEMYAVVAEILAYVYRIDKRDKSKTDL